MESWIRRSGVVVTASDRVATTDDGSLLRRLAAAASGEAGRRRRGDPASARGARRPSEESTIVAALSASALQLVDAIELSATPGEPAQAGRRGRRVTGEIELEVPLGAGEAAAILLERDGVYAWQFASSPDPASGLPESGPVGRRNRIGAGRSEAPRTARFRLGLLALHAMADPAPTVSTRRRGTIRQMLRGRVVALVFRFVARPALLGATRFLERKVNEGMLHVDSIDPASWKALRRSRATPDPRSRQARVLLLVHGTFSSTVGSFGALAGRAEGRAWLQAALAHYDLILGWEHRSLSVLPSTNAADLLACLGELGFSQPPELDAIAFSRGGLVLRSLLEGRQGGPAAFTLRRAVFVACTNAGTELARPDNWRRLCDRYTNLAVAGVRAVTMLPGAADPAILLLGALRGLGGLVKTLAATTVHDGAIPGLAAMDPAGPFVATLNRAAAHAAITRYAAISSNFDRHAPPVDPEADALPPTLLQRLADRGSDALLGEANDLVVHVASMTRVGSGVDGQIRERHEFGSNSQVHHCAYFSQVETVEALRRWLMVPEPARPPRRRRGLNAGSPSPSAKTRAVPVRRTRADR